MNEVDPAFLAFLQDEESRAYDGTLLEEVEAAINSYNGSPYGDEEDGRSQVVSRDVAESCDYMLTSLMDVMGGADNVVELEPQNEDDEDICDDATQALHVLYRQRKGFRTLHDWAKAGLLEKIAVIKTCAEQRKKRVERLYHPIAVPDDAIEASETEHIHPVDGSPMIHAVTLEDLPVQFSDYHVPLEEFGFSPDTTADLDTSPYLNHHPTKTLSELVEMGYPREVVETLSDDGSNGLTDFSTLAQARDNGRALAFLGEDRPGMLRKVRYLEEYTFFDLDNDGIAERLKICRVGNTILNIEPLEDQPFEVWCSFPMQGRLVGQSFADKSMDIQRVNTVVERLMLDSGYQQLQPGTFIHEDSLGEHTIDDLLTIRPGRVVRFAGQQPPIPEQRNDITGTALQILAFKLQQRESRTGITRLNKGVDEDTLNDTARGQAQLMARGQQMERYVIRQFAEAFGRLVAKKVRLMRQHGQPFQIRVDGEYRQVDPSKWPEDFEVQVKVGLGSGSKQDRIMYRQMVAQAQSLAMQSQAPICTWENVFNNLSSLSRDMNLPPNDIWTHPDDNPQQPQPDPAVMKLQAELQIKQQQVHQAQQEGQAKLALMAQQHASDAQIQQAKAEMEAQLALRQQNLQAWLDAHQMALDAHSHAQEMKHKEAESKAKISQMRKGGALNK